MNPYQSPKSDASNDEEKPKRAISLGDVVIVVAGLFALAAVVSQTICVVTDSPRWGAATIWITATGGLVILLLSLWLPSRRGSD